MGEPPRLARASVDGDAHVDDVADLAEELVQLAVRHIEGHVADEEGARGLADACGAAAAGAGEAVVAAGAGGGGAGAGVLDGEAPAGEGGVVVVADGGRGGVDRGEVHVAETVRCVCAAVSQVGH